MPSYISVGGVWKPAHEKAVDINTGDVHDGLDREATEFIAQENGITPKEVIEQGATIGMKSSEDPQMLEVARQHGLTIEQWMERNKPTPKQEADTKKAQAEVVTHKNTVGRPRKELTKGGFSDGDSDFVKEYNKKG